MAASPSFMSNRSLKVYKRARRFFRTRLSSKDPKPSPSPSRLPPRSNSLLGVPAEIKQLIFELLADIPSLRALISTCSILYYSFHESESSILARFLQRRISPSLMHPALATLKSSEPITWSEKTAEDLVTLYTKTDKSPLLPKLTLHNALLLTEMNDHIQFFANSFASEALQHHPVTCLPEPIPAPISPSELCRIERTLYRFQFYCNLMTLRKKRLLGRHGPSVVISDDFAPWENEQLACIADHLHKCVYEAFFIIREDPYIPCCGYWRDGWTDEPDISYCLPLGLAFLRRLIDVRKSRERGRLLSAHPLGDQAFRDLWKFDFRFSHLPLSDLNEQKQRERIKPPAVYDRDGGPEAAWRWAYADYYCDRWYNEHNRNHLREWGYVMWDYDRLDGWGVLGVDQQSLREPWYRRLH